MIIKCKERSDIPVSHNNHLYSVGNSLVKYAQSYTPPKSNGMSSDSARLTPKEPKPRSTSKR